MDNEMPDAEETGRRDGWTHIMQKERSQWHHAHRPLEPKPTLNLLQSQREAPSNPYFGIIPESYEMGPTKDILMEARERLSDVAKKVWEVIKLSDHSYPYDVYHGHPGIALLFLKIFIYDPDSPSVSKVKTTGHIRKDSEDSEVLRQRT
ncbi:hypothetical protein HDU97_002638 [Phlyctochytrium planicorne]|nr:hypothetical protein HDU97_002638 [Phlyctochytrium planicorne]